MVKTDILILDSSEVKNDNCICKVDIQYLTDKL